MSAEPAGPEPQQKPTLVTRLERLNQFVHNTILKEADSADIANAELKDITDVRQLIAAVRECRLQNSRLRQRSLNYRISEPQSGSRVTIETADGTGRLTLPKVTFHRRA